jgi:hypothetical protein
MCTRLEKEDSAFSKVAGNGGAEKSRKDRPVDNTYCLLPSPRSPYIILFHNLHSVEAITYVRSLKPRFIETV